ncbi:MAG: LysR family transcriptional regulator [Rhizobiaceae bacterium]|nr:LysR family transcriptional regulator [Rhizobiaceae bacterium]
MIAKRYRANIVIRKIDISYTNMHHINLRTLDLNLLVALDVLLEEKHITQAAERLNLSQSAMSHIFSRLREALNDDLLVRGQFGYEKTQRADEIEAPLKDALQQIQLIYKEKKFEPKVFEGSFNISTLGYGEAVIVPQLMKLLSRSAPKAQVNIVHRPDSTFSKILSGEVDVMFSALFDSLHKSCRNQLLFEDQYICVVHKDHPLATEELTLKKYLEYPHSITNSGVVANTPIDNILKAQGKKRKILKRSSHLLASFLALKGTQLLQTVPERISKYVSPQYDLVEKELPFEVEKIRFGQIWHAKNHNNEVHRWFRDKIFEAVGDT